MILTRRFAEQINAMPLVPHLCHSDDVIPKTPRPEIVIGRSIAICVHPHAAWRTSSLKGRVFLLTAYAIGSYAVVLTLMLLRG